jgi:AraC family transcriptional regulator, arabinose operon regulatory protein
MGNLVLHMGALPRVMPIAPKVRTVGYLPARTMWIKREFESVDFSFILKGRGRLRCGKRSFPIKAPCVFMAWPGVYQEFGPEPEGGTWEQLFMVYDAKLVSMFDSWDIHPAKQPVWPIASPQTVRNLANELIGCLENAQARGMTDRIDRICERLLLESRLEQLPATAPHEAYLDHVRRHLAKNLAQRHDVKYLAREYGMAEVTFRKKWTEWFGTPFGQDLITMRIQEACRLLAETNKPIKDIAASVGFEDPLYFSRRFTKLIGLPASEYRKQFGERDEDTG